MTHTFNDLRLKIIDWIKTNSFKAVTKSSFECRRVDGNSGSTTAVFCVEKPEVYGNKTGEDFTATNYIVIKWNEISGGNPVRHYSVEIGIHSTDTYHVLELKDGLIDLLDYYNRPCDLPGICKFRLSNEGGIYKDEIENRYVDKLFFDCKLI